MQETWILELLASVRDTARSHAMIRLAEHLDDAILLAASEFHDAAAAAGETGAYAEQDRATAGGAARGLIH